MSPAITKRISRRPITNDQLLRSVNKEIVPALIDLIDQANALEEADADPFEADFGDGVSMSFDFTHSLGTYAVTAVIWDNATLTRQPLATESTPDENTYRVATASPPALNELHIAIGRMRG